MPNLRRLSGEQVATDDRDRRKTNTDDSASSGTCYGYIAGDPASSESLRFE